MDDVSQLILGGVQQKSDVTQNNVGNLRPVGSSTGFQKFNSPEEGISALDQNLQAYGKKGINTIRGVVSKWAPPSENDTESYIKFVANKAGIDPDKPIDLSNPAQRHILSGAIMLQEKGAKNIFGGQTKTPHDDVSSLIMGSSQPIEQQAPTSTTSNILQNAFNIKKDIGTRVVSGLDALLGIVPQTIQAATYASARAAQRPEEQANKFSEKAASYFEPKFGQALGVQNTEAYKHPLGQIPAKIGEYINHLFNVAGLTPEQISEKTGVPASDIRNMVFTGSMALPGLYQTAKEALPVVEKIKGGSNIAPKVVNEAQVPSMQNAGAAATTTASEVKAALADAPPRVQQVYANADPSAFTANDIKAINNHKLFDKFGDIPTAGEALEDPALMSEEHNTRNLEENKPLLEKFNQRTQKVLNGFDIVKEKIAPEVYETTPVKAANLTLEKLVADDEAHKASIRADYKNLADANGGELPLNTKGIIDNANADLKKARIVTAKTNFLPTSVQNILEDIKSGPITYDDYENYLTILGNEYRKAVTANDGNSAHGIRLVRNAFENTEMAGKSAEVNALAKKARANAKARFDKLDPKSSKYIPAYDAAVNGDIRTEAEKTAGTTHPAANTFIEKHYNDKTPQIYLDRLINEIGRDSAEHQGLNSALIDKFKNAAGPKANQGPLNKQIKQVYVNNLDTMFGPEKARELHDLADYARKTDHTAIPGNYSNVSSSGMVVNAGPIGQAFEKAGSMAANAIEQGINLKTGLPLGTIGRSFLKGDAEKKAAEALAKQKAEKLAKTLSPTAGIRNLSDLGKTK